MEDLICNVIVTGIKNFHKKGYFREIGRQHVKGILFKSYRNRNGLTIEGARRLINSKIGLIGIDQMSIEEVSNKSHPVHHLLLRKGIIIVEGLNLKKVKPGRYKLICLPLKIKKGDGAPVRAVLGYDKGFYF